jgi:Mlc titration factor MtfA (ptsG expression regulator)
MLQISAIIPEDASSLVGYYSYYVIFFIILYFLFQVFENWYAEKYHRPLFRNILVFRTLSKAQETILKSQFAFYNTLSKKHKKQFRHRVATFINDKEFVGREGTEITIEMQTLVAAIGCMLSFGRKKYLYGILDTVIIFPKEFYSAVNDAYHKGEFNPRGKTLVLSWKHFKEGYQIDNDNYNLGLHEFMHAMHLEAKVGMDLDASRFMRHFQLIMRQLGDEELKKTLDNTKFFRAYAFTNQYEFMAVLTEYFFESPKELKQHFPVVYDHVNKALNLQVAGF